MVPKRYRNLFGHLFEARNARFKLGNVQFRPLLRRADTAQMLQDDAVYVFSHQLSREKSYSASAPEMISISSLVIIAWRVRLYLSVCLRIISPALRVALSIADICAP